jgi:hypothetical protein
MQLDPTDGLMNISGRVKLLHSIEGCLGKSTVLDMMKDGVERHVKEVGSKHGSEGALFGMIIFSSVAEISRANNLIYREYAREEEDEHGKKVKVFDPPKHVTFGWDFARAFGDGMAEVRAPGSRLWVTALGHGSGSRLAFGRIPRSLATWRRS